MSTHPRPPCKPCWRDKKKFVPAKFLVETKTTAFDLLCAECRKGYNCVRDKPLTVYRLELDNRVLIYRKTGDGTVVKNCWTVKDAEKWIERRKKRGDKDEYQIFAPAQHEEL